MKNKWIYSAIGIILAIPIVAISYLYVDYHTSNGPSADELVEFEVEVLYEIYAEGIVCIQQLQLFEDVKICDIPMARQKEDLYLVIDEMKEHMSIIDSIKYRRMEPHLDFRE